MKAYRVNKVEFKIEEIEVEVFSPARIGYKSTVHEKYEPIDGVLAKYFDNADDAQVYLINFVRDLVEKKALQAMELSNEIMQLRTVLLNLLNKQDEHVI
jgi:hypothetical protein